MPNLHWTRLGLCALLAAAAMLAGAAGGRGRGHLPGRGVRGRLDPGPVAVRPLPLGLLDGRARRRRRRPLDPRERRHGRAEQRAGAGAALRAGRPEPRRSTRNRRPPGLRSREAAQYLDVVVEYADGERVAHNFSELECRTAEDSPRPVAAVQVGSGAFDLISERVPVNPQEANVFTFRFIPNDLGRVEFRNQRVAVEPARSPL